MGMKSKLLLLAGMAELFSSMDRTWNMETLKKEKLGGFRENNNVSKSNKTPKTKKRRAKNKKAKASRKKNRK